MGRKRISILVFLFLGSAVAATAFSGCSTTDVCDEACEIWNACDGLEDDPDAGYYPYNRCLDECEDDDGWTKNYLRCLRRHEGDCQRLETLCG